MAVGGQGEIGGMYESQPKYAGLMPESCKCEMVVALEDRNNMFIHLLPA